MTSDEIKQAQLAINKAGFVPALSVDGIMGPKTQAGLDWLKAHETKAGELGVYFRNLEERIPYPDEILGGVGGAAFGAFAGPAGAAIGGIIGLGVGYLFSKIKGHSFNVEKQSATMIAEIPTPPPPNVPKQLVPEPSFQRIPGETTGQRIARIVRFYEGASLSNRKDELGALVARGVDDPNSVVGIKTNCAMFALGILKAAGVQHPLLDKPYVNGMAFTWLVQIGNDMGAWRTPDQGTPPVGAAMWYRIPNTNDDHIEFMLTPPDEHGGGGRVNNAITIGKSDISTSMNRPLYKWLDPNALKAS